MSRTILILGDQLSLENTALSAGNRHTDRVLLMEAREGTARTHKIKRVFEFSAMRHFAEALRGKGWEVDHHAMGATPDLRTGLENHAARFHPEGLVVMEVNNWAPAKALEVLAAAMGLPLHVTPTCQFVTTRQDFAKAAEGKKRLLMETHYRSARVRLGILVDAQGQPEGGLWNYDAENRKTVSDWKKDGAPQPPSSLTAVRPRDAIVEQVILEVNQWFPDGIGRAEDCWLPVTRGGALEMLDTFIHNRLPFFGDYQDLMLQDSPTMFHSLVAAPINIGLLSPMECVTAAVAAYRGGKAPLAAVEGFVRQIIGWREFVNGVYWLKMPDYGEVNSLEAKIPLPEFFYSAKTEMNCLRCVIGRLRESSYNHHIERLMIIGNFCLLAGIHPRRAHDWFLEMYIDAHEWVMAANVLGMALHADGGFMATKPYAASAAYISKMGNYCQGCHYDPKKKSGPGACPFNLLYWDFYDRHAGRFGKNPRTSMMVNSWSKRPEAEKEVIRREASRFLSSLETMPGGDTATAV